MNKLTDTDCKNVILEKVNGSCQCIGILCQAKRKMQHAHCSWIQHSTPAFDNKHQLHNLSNKLTSEDAKTLTELDIHLAFKYFSKQQDCDTSLQR